MLKGKGAQQQAPAQKGKPQKANWQDAFVKKGVGQDDMTLLSKVNNDDISDNLRKRFEANIIYTYIGHVLIAVNPYRDVGIYGEHILREYVGKNRIEMPPHVYATAEAAYHQLAGYRENQCVIISGESGAGKTESAKKIMEYVAAVSTGEGENVHRIKDIVLATNPLLEAFGNAKTLRNNNSSRFGKYFEMEFNPKGEPVGGVITNYLLEKGRVCNQINGERNFHIFYNLTQGANATFRNDFQVHGPDAYAYTAQSNCLYVDGMDDAQDFQDVLNAMNVIGVTAKEQYQIFRLLSAILWLGNVTFYESSQDQASISDPAVVDMVAYLLEVDSMILKGTFAMRLMETTRAGQRATTYNVPLNCAQAAAVRDALAKSIYDRLFDWIVERVNNSMKTSTKDRLLLGVLDIYGFEIFDHNSFEQLCINYVNEKLQQIFIELTLKQEQEEYVREKIKWTPIDFFNNKIVCDLIEEKKPPGIFSIMDDACATAHADPAAADKSLMQRLGTLGSNPHFKDLGQAGFLIRHYAGDVTYEAAGMTDKNKDQLVFDLVEAIQMSKNPFLLSLFPEKVDRSEKKKPTTASTKIKTSCNALVTALSRCTPHYIRCLKPNDNKRPGEYDQKRCIHQVRYLGLLENIRVRRAGFAFRQVFDKFLDRFFLLSRRTSYAGEFIWQGDAMAGCRAICEDCGISRDEWQVGTTKVFIRHPETLWALEHLRERYWHNMAMKIQRAYRNYVRYKHECATRIQRCFRAWNNTKIYLQVRDYGHQVLGGRKERRRFSLLSMRRFMGDYLEFRLNTVLQNACGPQAYNEGVVFTSKIQILVHKLLKGPKASPRFLVMTRQAIYIIVTKKEKNLAVTELERRIPLQAIQSVGLSPFMDDGIILYVPSDHDAALFCMFKTELVTHLAWHTGGNISVNVSSSLEYQKKPGKKAKLLFAKDELQTKDSVLKKGTVFIASGAPPSSLSDRPCRRNEPPPKPVTQGKLLRKGGPGGPPGGASKPTGGAAPRAVGGGAAPKPTVAAAAPKSFAPPPTKKNPLFKGIFPYERQDPGELSFPEGAVLEILEKDNNGWWNARYLGAEGWVPSNYLEEYHEPAAPASKPAPKPAMPAASTSFAPKPSAAGPQGGFTPPGAGGPAGLKPKPSPAPSAAAGAAAPSAAAGAGGPPGGFAPPGMGAGIGPGGLRPAPKPAAAAPAPTPAAAPKPAMPAAAPKPAMPAAAPKPSMPGGPTAAPKPSMPGGFAAAPKPAMPAAAPKPAMPAAAPKPAMPAAAPKPAIPGSGSKPPSFAAPGGPVAAPKPMAGPKPGMPAAASSKPAWAATAQRPPSPDQQDDDDWD